MAKTITPELSALLNAVEESVREVHRPPERGVHRMRGSIIDPVGDGVELSRIVIDVFRKSIAESKMTLDA